MYKIINKLINDNILHIMTIYFKIFMRYIEFLCIPRYNIAYKLYIEEIIGGSQK